MTVLEAYQELQSMRKVAKLLHMPCRTVAKYLKDPRPRRYTPRPPRPSNLAPFSRYADVADDIPEEHPKILRLAGFGPEIYSEPLTGD